MLEDAGTKAAYEQLVALRGSTGRLRALVMGDILKAPVISTLDISKFEGKAGDTIRVVAEDSVGVARLSLTVQDVTAGQLIEEAEMQMNGLVSGTVEWVFTMTAVVDAGHEMQVKATAYDLAGNMVVMSLMN